MTLSQKVAKFRELARDILRMNEINELLSQITQWNIQISKVNKLADEAKLELKRAEYKLSKLDALDPDFDQKSKRASKEVSEREEEADAAEKQANKTAENANKSIEDLKLEITKWESGENKVSLDSLEELSNKLILNDYKDFPVFAEEEVQS
jgi:hypothetical protein